MVKPLTCSGNAVKAHKGIEAGSGTRQDACQAKWSKTTHTEFIFHTERSRETCQITINQ